MGGSVNKVILIGRLARDPEIRRMNSGDPVCSLRVVTSERWKDKQTGERRDKAEFHNVVVFNEYAANFAEKHLTKGALVHIEGQLQTRKYTDRDGNERYTTEVVVQRFKGEVLALADAPDREEAPAQQLAGNSYRDAKEGATRQPARTRRDDPDDASDIPF